MESLKDLQCQLANTKQDLSEVLYDLKNANIENERMEEVLKTLYFYFKEEEPPEFTVMLQKIWEAVGDTYEYWEEEWEELK